MAKNPQTKQQLTAAQVLEQANTALESANTALAKAEEDLKTAQGAGDEKDIAAAQTALEQAQADQKAATDAAVAAATAAAPTAPTPPEQPPAPVVTESDLDTVEDEVKAFIAHLMDEIRAAEKSGDVKLHAWLVSLEGHLVGLKNHLAQEHPQASAVIETLVADVKALF